MGAASKFIVLIAAPLPVLLLRPRPSLVLLSRHSPLSSCLRRHHHHHLASSPLASNHSLIGIGFSVKASRRFHTHPAGLSDDHFSDPSSNGHRSTQPGPFSWPQWSRFHDCLSSAGYYDHRRFPVPDGIVFACVGNIPERFMQVTRSCLAFAHNRPDLLGYLSGGDIEVVISNCLPFLFEDAADTTRRMKSFLSSGRNNLNLGALESEKASTVDLMKFLVSYINNPTQSMEKTDADNKELIQLSVQNILSELAQVIPVASTPTISRQNIEMKKGDWICPRCEFMNFARNWKCLECEEARPPRQLTGGEWECPQCDFFNYGRNMVCIRCDCKRPGQISVGSDSGLRNGNERGISEGNGASDVNKNLDMTVSKRLDEVLGRTYPTPNTVNKRTSASGTNTSPTQPGNPKGSNSSFVPVPPDTFAQKSRESKAHESGLEGINSFEPVSSKADKQGPVSSRSKFGNWRDQSLVSPRDTRQADTGQENGNNHVPFVPFPPDYFAKKDKRAVDGNGNGMESSETARHKFASENTDSVSPPASLRASSSSYGGDGVQWRGETQQMGMSGQTWGGSPGRQTNEHTNGGAGNFRYSGSENASGSSMNNENVRPTPTPTPTWTGKSLEGSAVKEPDPLDMSEEAKAERFFRRAAQIKDISELSQIPDEDFPSIMPMRRGVNRFVVSKRKTPMERRLTSSQYRRNLPVVSSDSVKKENEDS